MKLKKIYCDVVSELVKGNKVIYGEKEDEIWFALFRHVLFFVPKKIFCFDLSWLQRNNSCPAPDDISDYENAYITRMEKKKGLGFVVKLETEKKKSALVLFKYLGYFDDKCEIKIKGERDIILVCENGEMVGGIMPILYFDGEKIVL